MIQKSNVFKSLGGVDVDKGRALYNDLQKARSSLVIANYLHLLYVVTPYDLVDQVVPVWPVYLTEVSHPHSIDYRYANDLTQIQYM